MFARVIKNFLVILTFASGMMPSGTLAQRPIGTQDGSMRAIENVGNLDVYVKGPNGGALTRAAVVTLAKVNGQFFREGTARAGHLRIENVPPTEYNLRVVAPGFSTATKKVEVRESADMKVTIELEATSEGINAISDREAALLGPKAQKVLGKAIEALRMNKTADARGFLDNAYRMAPGSGEVQYLYGAYELRVGDSAQARSYWAKTLELDPEHYRALISMSEALLHENKAGEAMPYLERAVKAEPTAWRPHALTAEAYLKQGLSEEAIQQAERAQSLGHGKAAVVQPVLAAALFKQGKSEQAMAILQNYVKEHPSDTEAKKEFAALQNSKEGSPDSEAMGSATVGGEVDVLPSSWLPPDIDEKVGDVEPGAVCNLDEVLKKTGNRIQEFLQNVDRFTATESMQRESINKWGIAASPINRKFEYLVDVEEVKAGFFSVEEYRTNSQGGNEFADDIASIGVPAMILILHQHNTVNFDIACEGLATWNGRKAWQVHFRQRSDRPNTMRAYKMGLLGQAHAVGLKGRAWIAADTFQVLRMETQMIAPMREIHLAADYTAIEYAPVYFKGRDLEMWLPQSAEVYSDWKGRRFHWRHSFSNYLLFSVDDKQHISLPKTEAEAPATPGGETSKPNP